MGVWNIQNRKMEITAENLQKKVRLNLPAIKRIATTILRREGVNQAILSFVFVSHQKIRALNKEYLNRHYATDVLAFDLGDSSGAAKRKKSKLTGDIIISVDAARKNAKEQTVSANSKEGD